MREVALDELGALGFGSYRVDVGSTVHRRALAVALQGGCNLIDTAPSYGDGRSEALIGDVLDELQLPAFVITKAGYVSPSAVEELRGAGVDPDACMELDGTTLYSLDPDVLGVLLRLSRERLRRDVLDAVLLHNPERMIDAGAEPSAVRTAIEVAFAFLAGEVEGGRLRYYGVSSNLLPGAGVGDPLDFETLADLASRAPHREAFRFVEFPLNLLEREGASDGSRPSLLSRVPSEIHTVTNRPLNAIDSGRSVRLADFEPKASISDPWNECVDLVSKRLSALGEEQPWTSFRPMQFLRDSRLTITDPDLVDVIWDHQIVPFLFALFDGEPPAAAVRVFEGLRTSARERASASLAASSCDAVDRLTQLGLVEPDRPEPLAVTAIRYCLEAGADHVLVGMRRPEYSAQLRPLFGAARGRACPPAAECGAQWPARRRRSSPVRSS